MLPLYKFHSENLEVFQHKNGHVPPHIHSAMECVYVTEGTLEVGIGQELYHMEKNDLALIFPDTIHHYQVFCEGKSRSTCLLASPSLSGAYLQILQQKTTRCPVIKAKDVHPDVVYALKSLLAEEKSKEKSREKMDLVVQLAFVQLILARCLPKLELVDRDTTGGDIIFDVVVYIAANFTEEISLESMAKELGYSPYAISRVFSSTFHSNFNQYLNEYRLEYARSLLHYTNQTITEVYENAGFQSQRTFNRVFFQRYGMSPREYRRKMNEQDTEAGGEADETGIGTDADHMGR